MMRRLSCPGAVSIRWNLLVPMLAASLLATFFIAANPAVSSAADAKTVVGWGRDTWGESDIPDGLNDVKQISGAAHSLVLHNNGTVTAWGDDEAGEAEVPAGLTGVTSIAAGGFFSMALRNNGTVTEWGADDYGQSDVPAGLDNVIAVSGGRYHALALKSDGTVVAWGRDDSGQATVPSGLDNVIAIDGGGYHSLALKSDGTVVAWGDDTYGQSTVPSGLHNVVAVAAGWYHSLALEQDGTVVAWGQDTYGQADVPTDLPPAAAISAGATHTSVELRDGTVATWGDNSYDQREIPPGITGVIQITGKAMNTLVLADDPPPTSPTNLTAPIVTSTKVTLNWGYPSQPTDRDIAQIIVRGSPGETPPATVDDGVAVPTGHPLQQQVNDDNAGLTPGKQYSYSVFAKDKAGNIGSPATITVPVKFPAAVTGTTATANNSNSVTLTWTNPTDNQLKKIIVRRANGATPPATPDDGKNIPLDTAQSETTTNTGLAPNTQYSYSIFAQDRIGNISPLETGSTATITTPDLTTPPSGGDGTAPPAVTDLTAPIVTSAKTTLNWTYSTTDDIVRIIVRGEAGTTAPATVTDGHSIDLGHALADHVTDTTGLDPGQHYSYSVFTQNSSGYISDPASITVPVKFPAAVTGTTATANNSNSVTLTWTNPTDNQLKKIIVRRANGATPPATPDDGKNIPLDTAQSETTTNTGLAPN